MAAVVLLALAACSSPDDPATVRREVAAACTAAAEERAALDAVDAEEFSRVGIDFASTFRDATTVMVDADADDALATQLEELANAMGEVRNGISAVRSSLELRELDDLPAELAAAREAVPALDETAVDLDLDQCRPEPLVSEWIDAAEARGDELTEATAPTGDYGTDLEAACGRFAEDNAIQGPNLNTPDALLTVRRLQQAFELLRRDIAALEPAPEDRSAHEELLGLIDQAMDIVQDASDTGLTTDEREALVDDYGAVADQISDVTAELGARC